MDPFLSWFIAQALGPTLGAQGLSILSQPNKQKAFARQAIRASGTNAPRRAVRRWLGRQDTWSDLVSPSEAGVERLHAELGSELGRCLSLRQACRKISARREASRKIVREVIAAFLQNLDPSLATSIAHFREMKVLAEVVDLAARTADNTDDLLRVGRARRDSDELLRRLPPPTRRILEELLSTGTDDAVRLLDVLAAPRSEPFRSVSELIRGRPDWLGRLPPAALVALAEFTAAHGDGRTASALFEEAAEAGATDRPRLLAQAAGHAGDEERGARLIERARALVGGSTPFIDAQEAAICNDSAALVRAGEGVDIQLDTPLAVLVAQGLAWEGSRDKAIAALRAVGTRDPESSAARVLLARYLLERASVGEGPARDADLRAAANAAIEARDLRRSWSGDSTEPVHLAVGAAAVIPDLALVLRLGLTSPNGDAQPAEAEAQEVLAVVALAASSGGLFELARECAGRISNAFLRDLTLGDVFAGDGDEQAAAAHLNAAWQAAESEDQKLQVQLGLAQIGHPELPEEEGLQQRADDPAATWILAIATWKRGHHEEAVRMLLPWKLRDRRCTNVLDEVLRDMGRDEESIQLLMEAAHKWRSPNWLIRAVRLLATRGRLAEADELIAEALAATTSADGRRALLEVRVAAAQERLDWVAMERSVRDLLDLHPDDQAVRWLLAGTLYNQRRLSDAWREIARPPSLVATNEVQAVAWVDLACRYSPGDATAAAAMDLHNQYQQSEDLHAAVVIGVMTMNPTQALSSATIERFAIVRDAYLEHYPNSDRFWTVDIGDTPEMLGEALSEMLRPHAERLDELQRDVQAGVLPSGVLSLGVGRPYALTFIARAAECTPAVAATLTLRDLDRADASNAVGGPVVAEASVLYIHAILPTLLTEVLAALSSIRLGHSVLEDLRRTLEHLNTRADGSLGWDLSAELPTFDERVPNAFARASGIATRMLEVAESFALTPDPVLPEAEDPHDPRLLPWAGALEMARQHELPLYSDDVGLRMVARNEGIRTFDTLSLLEALASQGRLPLDLRNVRHHLHKNYVVDLPFDSDLIRTLAEEDEWSAPSPASACFARPALWREDPGTSLVLYLEFISECCGRDPDQLAAWLFSAMVGVVKAASSPFHASRLAADLLVRTAFVTDGDPSVFAQLVAVAHEVARRTAIVDPVEPLIEALFTFVASNEDPAAAASLVVDLGSELEGDDREVIRRVVFALGEEK